MKIAAANGTPGATEQSNNPMPDAAAFLKKSAALGGALSALPKIFNHEVEFDSTRLPSNFVIPRR